MRVQRLPFLVVALALVASGARAARAQTLEQPRARQGYYAGLALLGAVNQNWENGDSLGAWGGSGYSLRLGQLITRRLGLGLEIASGAAAHSKEKSGIFGLGLEAHWEFARNFAIHGGVGLGVVQIKDEAVEDEPLRGAFGSSYAVGVSYDWFPNKQRLTGGWAISPRFEARLIPGEEVKSLVGFLGVELAYWTGLPRNQLELPESEAYKKEK
jgi:hypothetical protein